LRFGGEQARICRRLALRQNPPSAERMGQPGDLLEWRITIAPVSELNQVNGLNP
jgi:hypothetical protein